MASPQGKTKDGFELHLGTNHLAHFLLFQLLKSALLSSSTPGFSSRVVSLASTGHRGSPIQFDNLHFEKPGSYNAFVANGQAKTANLYFGLEVERRFGAAGLRGLAIHPGLVVDGSEITRHLSPEMLTAIMSPEMQLALQSPQQGAATSVWAALSPEFETRGGVYLEDTRVAGPYDGKDPFMGAPGYAPHAYDAEAAKKLWEMSLTMVGLKRD